jgi:hypothetical protein
MRVTVWNCALYASDHVKLWLICEWPCETVPYMRVTMWNCASYASDHVKLCLICEWPCETVPYMRVTMWNCALYASDHVKLCPICEWPCKTVPYMRVTMWNCALYASYHVQLWLRWCLWKQDCHYHCFYIFLDSDVTLPTLSIQFLSFVATHLNINSMRAEIHLHAYEMCLLSIRINNLFLCSHGKKHVLLIECNDKLSENYTNGIQFRFCPYNILGVTDRSINCHMALSALNYLYNILSSFAKLIKNSKMSLSTMKVQWYRVPTKER